MTQRKYSYETRHDIGKSMAWAWNECMEYTSDNCICLSTVIYTIWGIILVSILNLVYSSCPYACNWRSSQLHIVVKSV